MSLLTKTKPALFAIALNLASSMASTQAADLNLLTKTLAPAFVAQQYAALCAAVAPGFALDVTGPIGTIHAYASHIRGEVIAGLSSHEANTVVLKAADIARKVARFRMQELAVGQEEINPARMTAWCGTFAQPAIQAVMREHDTRHQAMDEILRRAKATQL